MADKAVQSADNPVNEGKFDSNSRVLALPYTVPIPATTKLAYRYSEVTIAYLDGSMAIICLLVYRRKISY